MKYDDKEPPARPAESADHSGEDPSTEFKKFKTLIKNYYKKYGRALPWRTDGTPYTVFVSEIMLQQTQVSRVLQKYPEFIKRFPDFASLAAASLKEIYTVWQGMGYNRRAKYLKLASEVIIAHYHGILPKTYEALVRLPGIGNATASSILAFAYNEPSVFIETNIRSVFCHFFFPRKKKVRDAEIFPLIVKALDTKNPRQWYWALMDYGAFLKSTIPNPSRQSKNHRPQTKFKGSLRETRGAILKILVTASHEDTKIVSLLPFPAPRIQKALSGLIKDGLVIFKENVYSLA